MRRLLMLLGLTAVVTVALAGSALAGPKGNKLTCFDGTTDGGYYGLCSVTKDGVATLDNVSNDATGTANPYDQYSGVYLQNSNLEGKRIGIINQMGFSYTGVATAGSPRISLGLDTNGDGDWDVFAFISAYYCNDGAGNVDALNDPTCTIWIGGDSWANWAAFVAAHPDYTVAYVPFIIADDPGSWTVSNVRLGKGSAGA